MIELFLKYWAFFAFVLNIVAIFFMTFITQRMNSVLRKFEQDKFEPVQQLVSKHDTEIGLMRQHMKYSPTRSDLHDLKLEIVELRGEHKEVKAHMKAISDGQAASTAALIRMEDRLVGAK